MQKQELLAPAGDIEAGYAALYYGADAVYLGLSKFSARATATNFDEQTLDEFTAYAHSLKRKVYVALNTVLQESELESLIECLDICTRCHIDGLIIQDLGVARVVKKSYPFFEMHASTQMAVHNKEGALFLQKIGFKRVVLARELTLSEIKEIASIKGLETEAFIHGALCYCYSGLCQFSAIEYGRSANRGKCVYPCRAAFSYQHKKEHLFSMKDMALEQDVLKLPVTSLKIEGRKKSALYVAAVTDYYRRILDGKGADVSRAENIKQIFSRPWCKFHFDGRNKSIIDRDFVGHRGLLIGQIESINRGLICFKTAHQIARHDGLQIDVTNIEKPFGFSVQNIFVNHKSCLKANSGDFISVELPEKYPDLHIGDKVYLSSSSEVKGSYHYETPKPHSFHNTYDIEVVVKIDENSVKAFYGEFQETIFGKFETAKNPQISQDAVKKAFAKTGDTVFKLKNIQVENPQNLFVPVSLLNELRRGLYSKIKIDIHHGTLPPLSEPNILSKTTRYKIKVDNLTYLENVDLDLFAEIIYLIEPSDDISKLQLFPKEKVRIALPTVCRRPALYAEIVQKLLEFGYNKWEAGNYWALEILSGKNLDICLDSSLYMLNSQAISFAKEIGVKEVTLSLEDTKENTRKLIKNSPLLTTLVVYQDVPLFTSVGCIRNNDCRNCNRKEQWVEIKDKDRRFKVLSKDCQTYVFDERAFCIAQNIDDLSPDYLRIDFCYIDYKSEDVAKICRQIYKKQDIPMCIKGNFLSHNI